MAALASKLRSISRMLMLLCDAFFLDVCVLSKEEFTIVSLMPRARVCIVASTDLAGGDNQNPECFS